ncbi:hypothetical protein Scep_005323 [Stephania cephalantha]|uniref:Protein kinase domain-containing protein n=1 Tax=Stephania cephalantha TaxID=152367 RepID=A0AAP0KVP8_9MAGN
MVTRCAYVIQLLHGFLFFGLFVPHLSSSQKTCPNCGSMQVPYPLSTSPNCGDPDYAIRCDARTNRLFFDALNGSSYLILSIHSSTQRMVLQPSPWVLGKCTTQDLAISEGLWLNQTLPFNITSSNTVFLFNCSPRLLVSPLNCTPASLCHSYLGASGHIDPNRASQCATEINPCCTFIAGGMPSAYKIRLHDSGCQAFRSIVHLDSEKPAREWEEGLEIQWAPPPEIVCKTKLDCSNFSKCSTTAKPGISRCLCIKDYFWDHALGACSRNASRSRSVLGLKVGIGILFSFVALAVVMTYIRLKVFGRFSNQSKLAKVREEMLKAGSGWKSARLFSLKEVRKATFGFSRERILGSGGFGEVYKGELQDGTTVAIKSAKVGNIKSTNQVLNEVEILSQVNHRHLVRLLGCCVEAEQPLLIYEYIPNGTLHDHLHGKRAKFLDLKSRLRIAIQTAEALAYLHFSTCTPIYHRDVKTTNILLDDELNAKVSDFGLSRLAQPGLSHVSTCAQGTLGYLDPEYYKNYQLTDKSDVYSYGVVLLEVLTSQRAIDFSRDDNDVNLAMYVFRHVDSGKVMDIVDQQFLGGESSIETVTAIGALVELALACLREKKGERPSMKDVVEKLQLILDSLH